MKIRLDLLTPSTIQAMFYDLEESLSMVSFNERGELLDQMKELNAAHVALTGEQINLTN